MLATYKARLRDDKLIWDDVATDVPEGAEVRVYITILEQASARTESNGALMAEAMRRLAALPEHTITDPVAWEREQREDRPLPGRD